MASVKKQDALVMVYARNAAAQDVVNGLGNLTRGRAAMEKATAALGALHIQAFWSRKSVFSPSAPAAPVAAATRRSSYGIVRGVPSSVSVMPTSSIFRTQFNAPAPRYT
jgi:hypothetical protein